MRTRVDQILIGLNLLVGAALLYFLFAPDGLVTARVGAWALKRTHARYASAHWSDLANGAARLDRGHGAVRVVVFSDYECPYCRRLDQSLAQFMAADTTVGVAVRHYPLASHPSAEKGARAAWCAGQQGLFAGMHHELFSSARWLSDTAWSTIATGLAIPAPAKFHECLQSDASAEAVRHDAAFGDSLGVRVTPTMVVDGAVVEGALTATQLATLLHQGGRE